MKKVIVTKPLFAALTLSISTTVWSAPAAADVFQLKVGQGPLLRHGELLQVSSGDEFQVAATAGSSYCCTLVNDNASANAQFTDASASHGSVRYRFRGLEAPTIGEPENRVCFAASNDLVLNTVTMPVTVVSSLGLDADNTQASCVETTLFGGFNTITGPVNFLEIHNTVSAEVFSGDPINGTITLRDSISGETDTFSFQVLAGARADIPLHGRFSSAAFGTVRLSHDGPPEGLKATVRFYKVTSNDPLALEPVSQEVFSTRK